jgi:CRP-like cAMP-binding protein
MTNDDFYIILEGEVEIFFDFKKRKFNEQDLNDLQYDLNQNNSFINEFQTLRGSLSPSNRPSEEVSIVTFKKGDHFGLQSLLKDYKRPYKAICT